MLTPVLLGTIAGLLWTMMRRACRAIMLTILAVSLVAGVALAAEPINPRPLTPQPVGATRWYAPFEIHMLLAYRLADLTRVDYLEFAGGAAGAGGSAGSSGSSGGKTPGTR